MDFEKLRDDLINYFGTALYYNQMAIMDLQEVKEATEEELIKIAIENNFDLERYEIKEK